MAHFPYSKYIKHPPVCDMWGTSSPFFFGSYKSWSCLHLSSEYSRNFLSTFFCKKKVETDMCSWEHCPGTTKKYLSLELQVIGTKGNTKMVLIVLIFCRLILVLLAKCSWESLAKIMNRFVLVLSFVEKRDFSRKNSEVDYFCFSCKEFLKLIYVKGIRN